MLAVACRWTTSKGSQTMLGPLGAVQQSAKHYNALGSVARFWWKGKPGGEGEDETVAVIDARSDSSDKSSTSNKSLVPKYGDNLPQLNPLIILPTKSRPIFPGFMSSILVKDEKVIKALTARVDESSPYVGVFLQKKEVNGSVAGVEVPEFNQKSSTLQQDSTSSAITSSAQLFNVGSFAQITSLIKTDVGVQVLLMGHRRISLGEVTSFGPPIISNVTYWRRPLVAQNQTLKAYCNEVLSAARYCIPFFNDDKIQYHYSAHPIPARLHAESL